VERERAAEAHEAAAHDDHLRAQARHGTQAR